MFRVFFCMCFFWNILLLPANCRASQISIANDGGHSAARVYVFASVKTWYCFCCCRKKWIMKKSSENDLLNLFRNESEIPNCPVMFYCEWVIKMRKSHVSSSSFSLKLSLRVIFILTRWICIIFHCTSVSWNQKCIVIFSLVHDYVYI